MFIACFWLALTRLQWLASPKGRSWIAGACALSCAALSWFCLSNVNTDVYPRLLRELDQNLQPRGEGIFDPYREERRIYAYLTLVAAGKMDPVEADAGIIGNREIRCRRPIGK